MNDQLITIRNQKTGETRQIPLSQASQYGLNPADYQPQNGTPVNTAPTQDQPQPDLLSSIGNAAVNLGKGIAQPFIDTARNLGTAAATIPQAELSNVATAYGRPDIASKIASLNIGGTQTNETANEVQNNPEKLLRNQVANSIEIGSYAIPFGKGGNILSKAVLPGAAVGGLQAGAEASKEDNATPDTIAKKAIGGAVVGGVAAPVVEGITKLPKILGGAGEKLEETGINTQVGKTVLKPSLTGAADEKAVQDTLARYGVKGTPQARYEKLEPTVKAISDTIESSLSTNAQPASIAEVKNIFMKKIESSVRQGNVTLPEAEKAFDEYFANNSLLEGIGGEKPALIAPKGTISGNYISNGEGWLPNDNTTVTTADLFNLKKDVQASSSQVAKAMQKAENKSLLTPQDKIMKTLRDSLDSVISENNPEVKQLTMDQSRLYDAITPTANARKTVPTVRALGVTLPKGPINYGVNAAGSGMEKVGNAVSTVGKFSPPSGTGAFIGSRLPQIIGGSNEPNQQNNSSNPQNGIPESSSSNNQNGTAQNPGGNPQNENGQNNTSSNGQHMPDITTTMGQSQDQGTYITGHSPEENYKAYLAAQANGDARSADVLYKRYQDEVSYQKANPGALTPADRATTDQIIKGFEDMRDNVSKDMISTLNPTSAKGEYLRSQSNILTQLLAKLVEKNRLSNDDRKFYLSQTTPQALDLFIPSRYEDRINGVIDSLKIRLGLIPTGPVGGFGQTQNSQTSLPPIQ